jgi:hypothetical protein
MKAIITASLLVLATAAFAQINQTPNQGYTISRPGGPTTFVQPTPNGGYVTNTPGVGPSFANPTPSGGYIVNTPRPGGIYGR